MWDVTPFLCSIHTRIKKQGRSNPRAEDPLTSEIYPVGHRHLSSYVKGSFKVVWSLSVVSESGTGAALVSTHSAGHKNCFWVRKVP